MSKTYSLALLLALASGSLLIFSQFLDTTPTMATVNYINNICNSCEYNVHEETIHPTPDIYATETVTNVFINSLDNYENNEPMGNDSLTDDILNTSNMYPDTLEDDIRNRQPMNDDIVDGATVSSRDTFVIEGSTVGNTIDRKAMSDSILDGATANSGALIHDNACIQGPTVDDWQTVSENLTYVYSAHLDPDSSETQSGIHIVGSILAILQQQPKYNTLTSGYYCRVWVKSGNQNETEVFTAQVINISGRGYTFGL